WVWTVKGLVYRSLAISALERPWAVIRSMPSSRLVGWASSRPASDLELAARWRLVRTSAMLPEGGTVSPAAARLFTSIRTSVALVLGTKPAAPASTALAMTDASWEPDTMTT